MGTSFIIYALDLKSLSLTGIIITGGKNVYEGVEIYIPPIGPYPSFQCQMLPMSHGRFGHKDKDKDKDKSKRQRQYTFTAGSATVRRVCKLVEEETSQTRSPTLIVALNPLVLSP